MAEETPGSCSGSCGSCSSTSCGDRTEPAKLSPNAFSSIKKVIAVVSGKGGVGKTLVTSLLASELTKAGYKVGILDADVTGPSIPKAFGVRGPIYSTPTGANPAITPSGIKIMSTNLLLPQEDMAVAWRGPVITGTLNQFFEEVNWGDLDYLLLDMPPGTSDVMLTIFQKFPVDAMITVSAPQELVGIIVGKAVNLAKQMDIPVMGLVENMAYYVCKDCGEKQYIYGLPQGKEVAEKYEIPAYATLPIDPQFARLVDAGRVEAYDVKGALDPVIDILPKLDEEPEA